MKEVVNSICVQSIKSIGTFVGCSIGAYLGRKASDIVVDKLIKKDEKNEEENLLK